MNAPSDRSQGRSGGIVAGGASAPATSTGNRALQIEEKLIFEMGQPGRTGVDLKPDTVIKLASHSNIKGIKEATGELNRVHVLRDGCGPEFSLLSGDDATACEFMLQGGDGVISVTGNVAAAGMRRLCDAARGRKRAEAERIDATLQPLHRNLFCESNPIPVKWAVEQMGLIGPGIRLPLTPLAPQFHALVLDSMAAAGVRVAAA